MRTVAQLLTAVALMLVGVRAHAQNAESQKRPIEFSDQLFKGSLVGAGLDPAAPAEVIRPSTTNEVQVSLRKLGGVFSEGKGSVAIQLNPYYLSTKDQTLYQAAVDERKSLMKRLYQDSALTVTGTAGLPFESEAEIANRFTTIGLGGSVELLGNRSIFSNTFSGCLADREAATAKAIDAAIATRPPEENPPKTFTAPPAKNAGETDDDYLKRIAPNLAGMMQYSAESQRYEALQKKIAASNKQISELVQKRLGECTQQTNTTTHAFFVSFGGRWVAPGVKRAEGDSYFIQREYLAGTYEFMTTDNLAVSLQARLLGDRTSPVPFQYLGDAALSLSYTGDRIRWAIDLSQALTRPQDHPGLGSISASLKVRLMNEVFVTLGVTGKDVDIGKAFDNSTLALGVSYEDKPVLVQNYR